MRRPLAASKLGLVTYSRVDGIAPLVCAAILLVCAAILLVATLVFHFEVQQSSSHVYVLAGFAIAALVVSYRILLRPFRVLRVHTDGVSTVGILGHSEPSFMTGAIAHVSCVYVPPI